MMQKCAILDHFNGVISRSLERNLLTTLLGPQKGRKIQLCFVLEMKRGLFWKQTILLLFALGQDLTY